MKTERDITPESESYTQDIQRGVETQLMKNQWTRDGFSFLGWAETPSGEPKYDDEATVTFTDNTDLYAVWRQTNVWMVASDNRDKYYDTDGRYDTNSDTNEVSQSISSDDGQSWSENHNSLRAYGVASSNRICVKLASSMTYGTNTTISGSQDPGSQDPWIFYSMDGGSTWERCNIPDIIHDITPPRTKYYTPDRIASGVGPNGEGVWIVGGWKKDAPVNDIKLYYSHDGVNFDPGKEAKNQSQIIEVSGNGGKSPQITGISIGIGRNGLDKAIAIDPGCSRIFLSIDCGKSWYNINMSSTSTYTNPYSGIFGKVVVATEDGFLATTTTAGDYGDKINFIPYTSLTSGILDTYSNDTSTISNSSSIDIFGRYLLNKGVVDLKPCKFTETDNINNKMFIKNMCYGNGKLVAIVKGNSSSVKMKVINARDNPGPETHWYADLNENKWSDCKLGAANFADRVSNLDDPYLNVFHYANGIFMLAHYNGTGTEIYTSENGKYWEKKEGVLLNGKVHGLTYC